MLKEILQTNLAGMQLRTPLLLASGVVGYAIEYERLEKVDFNLIGGIVLKGVNLHGKPGNKEPRIVDSTIGVINSIGLENPGVHILINDILPNVPKKTCIIANIFGDTVQEYGEVAAILESVQDIQAVEVNISCPNVKRGGRLFGSDPAITREVLSTVKQSYRKGLVIAKLSPSVADIVEIAKAAVDGGADAISLVNTMPALAINLHAKPPRPLLGNNYGGLSGPAIKPIALAKVCQVHQDFKARGIKIPLIGSGGIMNANDALEFLAAGASAVQIGTVMFTNHDAYLGIAKGIEDFLIERSLDLSSEKGFVGSLMLN